MRLYKSFASLQLTIHKVSFALIGCITPLMATSSALGILFFLGLRAGSILCVTPFLVLAIGNFMFYPCFVTCAKDILENCHIRMCVCAHAGIICPNYTSAYSPPPHKLKLVRLRVVRIQSPMDYQLKKIGPYPADFLLLLLGTHSHYLLANYFQTLNCGFGSPLRKTAHSSWLFLQKIFSQPTPVHYIPQTFDLLPLCTRFPLQSFKT